LIYSVDCLIFYILCCFIAHIDPSPLFRFVDDWLPDKATTNRSNGMWVYANCGQMIHPTAKVPEKVKGLDIYVPPPLTRKVMGRFTIIRSGVLTGNDTRCRSANSGGPLPEWTDFGPRSLQL